MRLVLNKHPLGLVSIAAVFVCLLSMSTAANQSPSTQSVPEWLLRALEGPSTRDTINERYDALSEIQRSEALRENSQVRMALIAALDRANDEYFASWRDTEWIYGEGQGELLLDLIGTVARLEDTRAIPALVRSVHTGRGAWQALADFGEQALDPILTAWEEKPTTSSILSSINTGLLSTMAYVVDGGELSDSNRARVMNIARDALTGSEDELSFGGGAIDLVVALGDSSLLAQVEAMAQDRRELVKRGIEERWRIDLMMRRARRALDQMAEATIPRAAWGRPDLQGVWDFRSITPLQRPEDLADRDFLTEEEAAELEQNAANRDVRLWEAAPGRTEAGGNVGAYNNFWMDRGLRAVETRRTALVVDPPNGRMPAMTRDAQRRAAERRDHLRENPAGSWDDFSAGVRCILGFNAGPPFTPSAYNNNVQLFQTPEHVVIVTEMVHTARIIPLDGRPWLDPDIRQWSGDSRGRWEGDTLVIETRNFDAKRRWRNTTEGARLVERLTRVDADTLNYEFTVTDPETWMSPWTASVPLALNPEPMYEYACHEGNYSMPLMLGGQRTIELNAPNEP